MIFAFPLRVLNSIHQVSSGLDSSFGSFWRLADLHYSTKGGFISVFFFWNSSIAGGFLLQINSPKAYALGELLVQVTGVEPARTVVRESESNVTLVKTTTVPLQRASCCYPEFKRRAST